jgi:hypothetical protein
MKTILSLAERRAAAVAAKEAAERRLAEAEAERQRLAPAALGGDRSAQRKQVQAEAEAAQARSEVERADLAIGELGRLQAVEEAESAAAARAELIAERDAIAEERDLCYTAIQAHVDTLEVAILRAIELGDALRNADLRVGFQPEGISTLSRVSDYVAGRLWLLGLRDFARSSTHIPRPLVAPAAGDTEHEQGE